MSQPYLGQILTFAGAFAPVGYMQCVGQTLSISQYSALYSLIGTNFGGDGVNSFKLPDLQGRTPIHMGAGVGLSPYVIGQIGGQETVALTTSQMPGHGHLVSVATGMGAANASATPGVATYLGDEYENPSTKAVSYLPFAGQAQVNLANASLGQAGGGLPHPNIQPFLAITYCIAVAGVFPSRN
ncbi:MAG: tail fiber protein [Roseiarcus sp.]